MLVLISQGIFDLTVNNIELNNFFTFYCGYFSGRLFSILYISFIWNWKNLPSHIASKVGILGNIFLKVLSYHFMHAKLQHFITKRLWASREQTDSRTWRNYTNSLFTKIQRHISGGYNLIKQEEQPYLRIPCTKAAAN